jgi:hypothetical protein
VHKGEVVEKFSILELHYCKLGLRYEGMEMNAYLERQLILLS